MPEAKAPRAKKRMEIAYRPIGIIHSEYTNQDDTPIQAAFSTTPGQVKLFSEYVPGIMDLVILRGLKNSGGQRDFEPS